MPLSNYLERRADYLIKYSNYILNYDVAIIIVKKEWELEYHEAVKNMKISQDLYSHFFGTSMEDILSAYFYDKEYKYNYKIQFIVEYEGYENPYRNCSYEEEIPLIKLTSHEDEKEYVLIHNSDMKNYMEYRRMSLIIEATENDLGDSWDKLKNYIDFEEMNEDAQYDYSTEDLLDMVYEDELEVCDRDNNNVLMDLEIYSVL